MTWQRITHMWKTNFLKITKLYAKIWNITDKAKISYISN